LPRLAAAEGALTFFSCVYVFIGLQACFAGFLDEKVTNLSVAKACLPLNNKRKGITERLASIFYMIILFFIGIKDCCAILVKTYGNLDRGSIEALTLAYSSAPA